MFIKYYEVFYTDRFWFLLKFQRSDGNQKPYRVFTLCNISEILAAEKIHIRMIFFNYDWPRFYYSSKPFTKPQCNCLYIYDFEVVVNIQARHHDTEAFQNFGKK